MDDHFDIKTLPSNFVSRSRPSQVIDNLSEKRKNDHKKTLEEMCVRKRALNIEIEEELLNKSNTIKSKLKNMRDDTDYAIHLILHTTDHEFESLEKSYFSNISTNIMNSNNDRKFTVDELYNILVEIEKKRGDMFKVILNETYTKLQDIGYKLPFELEELFEKEILKINQLTLNNHQLYTELRAEMKLQIENDMKLWLRKLYEVKDRYHKHMKEIGPKQSDDSAQQMDYGFIDTTFARMNRRLSEYDAMKMVLEFKLSQMYINVDLENISVWLQDVQMTMACLDRSAKYIVNIYKACIVVIFHRFFKELEDIKTSMLDIDVLSREEIEPYECEIYTPTADELDLQTDEEFETIKQIWGKLITYIEDSLNETYAFVKKATYLWDHHFIRIEEVQELVLQDVGNTIEKNNASEGIIENKLNSLLDRLRQCPTEQKLEKTMEEVVMSLDKIEEIYRIHNNEEQKVAEKFREFVDIEIDVLMAEINRFLTLHPPDEEMDPKKQRKRASQESHINIDPTEELIPHQMLFCRYQVEAVSNWMFGLWEAINHYLASGRAEIMAKAEEWIKLQCDKIRGRLTVKLSFFKMRCERIKSSIYKKRLEELQTHNNRLKSHQMAVELEVKTLNQHLKSLEEEYHEILRIFIEKSEAIFSEVLNSRKSGEVNRLKESLITVHSETIQNVITRLDNFNEECTKIGHIVRVSNFKFMKAIRLFSEDGNYNMEEAKNLMKILNKIDSSAIKNVEHYKKEIKSSFDHYKVKLDARFSEMLSNFREVFEEHKLNEKIIKMIFALQADIHKQIFQGKTSNMRLKKMIKSLLEASTGKLGNAAFLSIFVTKFHEIGDMIMEQAPFLIHPEPVLVYSWVNEKTEKPQTKPIKRPHLSSSKMEIKDAGPKLYHIKPESREECLVSNLNECLENSFSRIQHEVKEFYSKHRILLAFPKMQPSLERFMEEVLHKYRNFLVQCWLEISTDFVNALENFFNFKKHFLLAFENKYYNNALEQFSKVHQELLKKLRVQKETLETTLKNMHSKLKPLHGHPNNTNLLKDLEAEYKILIKELGAKVKTILPPHKGTLKEEYHKLKSHYDKIKHEATTLTQTDKITDLQVLIKGQIDTKTSLVKQLAGIEDENSSISISENFKGDDLPLSISLQIVAYMKSAPETSTDLITSITLSTVTSEDLSPRDFPHELHEKFEKYNQELLDADNKILKFFKNFQLSWANDLTNVQNLYKIKYDKV